MAAGDMLAFDTDLVSTYGYCCDISRSWIVGDVPPTNTQKTLYQIAYEHVMTNIEMLQPGMRFDEATEKAHRLPEAYRALRYGVLAHGIGLCDEYPVSAIRKMLKNMGMTGHWKWDDLMCRSLCRGRRGQ